MNSGTSIKLKAGLLLLVFSLNTMVSMACAMGVKMGFNTTHHDEEKPVAPAVHAHADGKKHHHGNEETKGLKHHESNITHHDKKDTKEMDGCCTDEILKFQQSDKSLNVKAGIEVPVLMFIVAVVTGVDLFKVVKEQPYIQKARYYYPPPPDIRIAIQSFQI